jgi:hypothetical protein
MKKGQKITAANILSAAASTHFVQFSELIRQSPVNSRTSRIQTAENCSLRSPAAETKRYSRPFPERNNSVDFTRDLLPEKGPYHKDPLSCQERGLWGEFRFMAFLPERVSL